MGPWPCDTRPGSGPPLSDDGGVSSSPTVVLLTGPPGTGKSSLAERAAVPLGAPVLGWDWTMAGLTSFESIQSVLRQMTHLDYRQVGWSILWNLATAQLRNGRSVVLDSVASDIEVTRTRELSTAAGVRSVVVATSCSDLVVHRSRVAGRLRRIPGWHELACWHGGRRLPTSILTLTPPRHWRRRRLAVGPARPGLRGSAWLQPDHGSEGRWMRPASVRRKPQASK